MYLSHGICFSSHTLSAATDIAILHNDKEIRRFLRPVLARSFFEPFPVRESRATQLSLFSIVPRSPISFLFLSPAELQEQEMHVPSASVGVFLCNGISAESFESGADVISLSRLARLAVNVIRQSKTEMRNANGPLQWMREPRGHLYRIPFSFAPKSSRKCLQLTHSKMQSKLFWSLCRIEQWQWPMYLMDSKNRLYRWIVATFGSRSLIPSEKIRKFGRLSQT